MEGMHCFLMSGMHLFIQTVSVVYAHTIKGVDPGIFTQTFGWYIHFLTVSLKAVLV